MPRFVYATRETFAGEEITDPEVRDRITGLVQATLRIARALASDAPLAAAARS